MTSEPYACVTCGKQGAPIHIVTGRKAPVADNGYHGVSFCSVDCVILGIGDPGRRDVIERTATR